MVLLHIHIMWGTIRTKMNKNTEGRGLNIHGTLRVFFILDSVTKPLSSFKSWISSRRDLRVMDYLTM